MDLAESLMASPAAAVALFAAFVWAPLTGFPTWMAMARGRYASTIAISSAVAALAFTVVQRVLALAQA
jgi:hypothetical protein